MLSRGLVPRSERARLSGARACSGTISRYKVGIRALSRGCRVRGSHWPERVEGAPHPGPLPANGARDKRTAIGLNLTPMRVGVTSSFGYGLLHLLNRNGLLPGPDDASQGRNGKLRQENHTAARVNKEFDSVPRLQPEMLPNRFRDRHPAPRGDRGFHCASSTVHDAAELCLTASAMRAIMSAPAENIGGRHGEIYARQL